MSVGFDPNSDFETITDGLEAVTLKHRGGPSEAIAAALQREITTAEVEASNGKYLKGDVRWHLPAAQVDRKPKPGDRIVDGNPRYYTVLDVGHATLENRWRCISRDLEIAYGLDDTVEIIEATYAKGDGGAMEPTFKTKWTGIRARIQPEAMEVTTEHRQRYPNKRFQIFIAEDIAITNLHRVKAKNGTVYKVLGYTEAERIGELQTISAEETPWPLG